jgi:hypothetical protein
MAITRGKTVCSCSGCSIRFIRGSTEIICFYDGSTLFSPYILTICSYDGHIAKTAAFQAPITTQPSDATPAAAICSEKRPYGLEEMQMHSACSFLQRLTLIFSVILALVFMPALSATPLASARRHSSSVHASKTSTRTVSTTTSVTPTITSLSPASVVAGGATFTLTVSGSNYLPGTLATVVKWNSTTLATTYISSTQVTAVIPSTLIAAAGSFSISVVTVKGTSAKIPFNVTPAPPILTSVAPASISVGHASFYMDIYGKNFTSAAVVHWGTTQLVTTFIRTSVLVAIVPANLVTATGTANLSVTTAGGTSSAITFTIAPDQPIITSLSPTSTAAGGSMFTLTVKGSNFISTSTVYFGSTHLATTYVSPTELTASVPASLIASAGTTGVLVYTPGGGKSPASSFTITPASPSITSLSPAAVYAGGAGFMLTIQGTAFTPAATTKWGATSLDTVYNSPTKLTVAVPASLIEFSGTASITVSTAAGTSAPATYTIKPALPTISGFSPGKATAGGAAFALTVYGTNFTSTSTVKWGSTALTTSYLSTTALTATVPAALIATAGTASITVNAATGTSVPLSFTINPEIQITTTALPSGTAGNAYSGPIHVTGGIPGYIWTVTGLPDYLTFFNTNDNTLTITGTPSSSGSVTLQVSVADTTGTTAGPVTYTIDFGAGPSGVNNGDLKGRYACLFQGSFDDDGGRWATLGSFQADGKGNFMGGVFDTNSHDVGSASGVMTGSYSIGADNNGLASIHTILTDGAAGIQTTHWALALASAHQPSQQFRMVENDDLGTLPSYQQGTADCYLSTLNAFSDSTLNGHRFVFSLNGEDDDGNLRTSAGLFTAANGSISNGTLDEVLSSNAALQTYTFTGVYAAPDSTTGRLTIALQGAGSSTGFTVYIIDADRMFILDNTSNVIAQAGVMRTRQQSAYSGASLSGPFVFYAHGGASSGYFAHVFTGTGDGDGHLVFTQSYANDAGVYSTESANENSLALTFDSAHPGRASYSLANGTAYLYLYDVNSALEIGIKNDGAIESGWLEPQTQTTFTGAALAGQYLAGKLPLLAATSTGNVGEYTLTGDGAITGTVSTAGQEESSWDQSVSLAYNWDTSVSSAGTFLISGTSLEDSCAVINPTKIVCMPQTDASPNIEILQQ